MKTDSALLDCWELDIVLNIHNSFSKNKHVIRISIITVFLLIQV